MRNRTSYLKWKSIPSHGEERYMNKVKIFQEKNRRERKERKERKEKEKEEKEEKEEREEKETLRKAAFPL